MQLPSLLPTLRLREPPPSGLTGRLSLLILEAFPLLTLISTFMFDIFSLLFSFSKLESLSGTILVWGFSLWLLWSFGYSSLFFLSSSSTRSSISSSISFILGLLCLFDEVYLLVPSFFLVGDSSPISFLISSEFSRSNSSSRYSSSFSFTALPFWTSFWFLAVLSSSVSSSFKSSSSVESPSSLGPY